MLRSILLGVDGSAYGKAALELGVAWAKHFDAILMGLGIVDEPGIREAQPVPLGGSYYKEKSDETRVQRARRKVEQFLEQFSLRCAEAGVASKVLEEVGPPHEQVLREGQRCDLILLGQQTYFQFATQEEPDETLRKVLKDSPRPVVTAPKKLETTDGPAVIAYDGSLQAAHALYAFLSSGLAKGREVHVVSAAEKHREAADAAALAEEYLRSHGVRAKVHATETSKPAADVILKTAKELGAGLLVMGAYGKPKLVEFFLGSVTKAVLKKAAVPLFLYH